MFGYIKPDIPELKVKDNELYKATYCGLCKTMGRSTGCMSKLTLSYDFAFLALVRMVTDKTKGEIKMKRCMAHPFVKRPMLVTNASLDYCAKTSVILTKMKLKDNVKDSHGLSRLKARLANIITVFFKKTKNDLKPLEKKVAECIDNLSKLEKENSDSIDRTASTFGDLLGSVTAYNSTEENEKLLYEIGFHLGKWIYVIDAVDDMKDDIKKKSYNVVVNSYGEELTEQNKNALYCAMMLELDSMSKSVELLDFSSHRDVEAIIKNVIYMGLVKQSKKILGLDACSCKK